MNTHSQTGHIWEVGDGIQVYLMPYLSEELTVIVGSVW